MSTTLLYHAWGIYNCDYYSTSYQQGVTCFKIKVRDRLVCCSHCKSRKVIHKGTISRKLKTLPIGSKPVFIELDIPRVYCSYCKVVRQIKLPFARAHSRATKALERYVIELSRMMTIKDIAHLLQTSWDFIKNIIKQHLKKRYDKPKLRKLKYIAIDEIYLGKQQGYMTLVLDLQTGAVVFTALGRKGEVLDPFWKRLKRFKTSIQAVATDMGPAYIKAVQDNLPDATLVFDHFHIIKLFNEKLTKLRRDLHTQVESVEQKKVFKGTRWLLLKRADHLNEETDEKKRLEEALKLNAPLATAYYLKEDLGLLWKQGSKKEAEKYLEGWIKRAEASGVNMLKTFAKKLATWRSCVLAYYDTGGLSTGPLEGINNKVKTMKRMAYGYRDMEFFQLKIKALHESRYALS